MRLLKLERDPGKIWERVSHAAGVAAFLPAAALFAYGDYQQFMHQPLPQIDNEALSVGGSLVFGLGALAVSQNTLITSSNRRITDMRNKERSAYLRARSVYRSFTGRGVSFVALSIPMILNGVFNDNLLNVGAGILMGSSGSTLLQRGKSLSQQYGPHIKRALGPQRV